MAIVVDASAIGAIAWGEPEGEEIAPYLYEETLLAPVLLDFELVSIALQKARKGPGTPGLATAGLIVALRIPIARVSVPAADVFALARRTGLTAYDASYLWLARSRDLELVTLDTQLLKFVAEDSRE
jgi:predicted nucleic acid-binding protein